MNNKLREALEKFSAVDLSRLKFPLDGDSSAIYNSDKKEITIPYWMVAMLLNEVKAAQDMAKAALAEPQVPIGNNAKMFEALAYIRLLLVRVPLSIKPDIACGIINAKVKHALAEPPRNCDVGAVEEQIERWRKFCHKFKQCDECPHMRNGELLSHGCFARWAQMPYEKEKEIN